MSLGERRSPFRDVSVRGGTVFANYWTRKRLHTSWSGVRSPMACSELLRDLWKQRLQGLNAMSACAHALLGPGSLLAALAAAFLSVGVASDRAGSHASNGTAEDEVAWHDVGQATSLLLSAAALLWHLCYRVQHLDLRLLSYALFAAPYTLAAVALVARLALVHMSRRAIVEEVTSTAAVAVGAATLYALIAARHAPQSNALGRLKVTLIATCAAVALGSGGLFLAATNNVHSALGLFASAGGAVMTLCAALLGGCNMQRFCGKAERISPLPPMSVCTCVHSCGRLSGPLSDIAAERGHRRSVHSRNQSGPGAFASGASGSSFVFATGIATPRRVSQQATQARGAAEKALLPLPLLQVCVLPPLGPVRLSPRRAAAVAGHGSSDGESVLEVLPSPGPPSVMVTQGAVQVATTNHSHFVDGMSS